MIVGQGMADWIFPTLRSLPRTGNAVCSEGNTIMICSEGMAVQDYQQFLESKICLAPDSGFDIAEVHPYLRLHQPDVVRWAVKGGRRGIFAQFGLGKTIMASECGRQIVMEIGCHFLVVCPLGVRHEFILQGLNIGIEYRFIRSADEITDDHHFYLTNYETIRDGKLDPSLFGAVALDEASVLRSYGSKTYQEFLPLFKDVPYRFVLTATPSPNRFKELIHYAGFLGIMDTGQALTRFFQRDSEKAGNLTLYPHKVEEFWLWVSSWAVFLQSPADLGYSDEGYKLPEMEIRYHEIPSNYQLAGLNKDGQGELMPSAAKGLTAGAKEKRDSMLARVKKVKEIVDSAPDDHFVIWHSLESERHAIQQAIPEAVSVWGTQDLDEREKRIIGFGEGEYRILSTKEIIAGSGCNFQKHCHREIFNGIGYKFNDFIQAVHRVQRCQQKHRVIIDIVYTESEREILRELLQKWAQHNEMIGKMTAIVLQYGIDRSMAMQKLARTIGIERRHAAGEHFSVANNDCVAEARLQPDNHVDLIVTSIPFANHYEYTPSYNDFGHTKNNVEFWKQMDYLTPELKRILKPGRLYCCHVKDRILFGNVTGAGAPTVSPFHAEAIFHGLSHGLDYMGMITIVTDVVRENNQTYRLGWSEQCKDGTKMGVGSPEYVLLFRKPQSDRTKGYADVRVVKEKPQCQEELDGDFALGDEAVDWDEDGRAVEFDSKLVPIPGTGYSRSRWQVDAHAFWRSSGNRYLSAEEMAKFGPAKLAKIYTQYSLENVYDYEFHVSIGEQLDQKHALPSTFMSLAPGSHHPDVWHDVLRMLTLNSEQSRRAVEQHVCLARDSLILTMEGYKPIQDVSIGDLVLTHKGRWRPVQVVRNTGIRPVITVRAQGVPGLTLTPEHKLWTRQVPSNAWAVAHSRASAKKTEPDWLEAERTGGSYINQKTLPVSDVDATDTELWLIGRWLADGHRETRGGFMVSIGEAKLDIFRQMAGAHAGAETVRSATQIRLVGLSPAARNILAMCGSGAENKEIPPTLLALPGARAKIILLGYLSGDGHFLPGRNRWMASTVSKRLALGLSLLAQNAFGAVASVYPGRAPGTTTIEGRTVNTKQDWIVCFYAPDVKRKNSLPFVLDDGAWKKVRSIEDAGEVETWCLRVEEDESFTAEGCIVKNCPFQIDVVDRLINRYSNPGEIVYDPFCGLGTVPVRAIKLGRFGMGSELNSAYFKDQVHYLQAMEREISIPDLFAALEEGEDA